MRIYLSGPDMYSPNFQNLLQDKIDYCQSKGHQVLTPMNESLSNPKDIYYADINELHAAEVVVADITPFRGSNCDTATAYAVGYAQALQKFVYLYSNDASLKTLIQKIKQGKTKGADVDGNLIEDFGFPESLMVVLANSGTKIYTSFEELIDSLDTLHSDNSNAEPMDVAEPKLDKQDVLAASEWENEGGETDVV